MDKIEHIGIAVKDIGRSNEIFKSLFDKPHYKIEEVLSEGVRTSFFQVGPNKFIARKGEGIHHIAFAVSDIRSEMKRLEKEGFQLLNKEPKIGADNKLVAFVHPKTSNGVLVELCQERN